MANLIGRSFLHAADPADWLFSHNLYCGRGNLSAVSAWRQADPNLTGAMSLYEAFTRERPKEDFFEQVRAREFPEQPSRLGSIYLFTTREIADACNAEWWSGARTIHEARIVSAFSVGIFDSRQLDADPEQWEAAARRYWAGELTPNPRPEVVLNGTIHIVEWERHARLGLPSPTSQSPERHGKDQ